MIAAGDGTKRLASVMTAQGIDVALVNLTRQEVGVPVVQAIASALQQTPGGVITERLNRAMSESGGTNQWTGGIHLM